ncbi:type II secretion system protein [Ruficoccus amylovorans]|uniref:Type II secretion system protein n=1 Tax=Ruficoccus amylovorans TaxID=1804625 RepID=A0A842HI00_9BACT|nr:type II secretion system protein [Ruficoccus amylovorans]MBC2596153.1 type II secretion system protein [Ruficoccus amylovorans]
MRSPARRRRQPAFTVIEVFMVVSLLAAVLGLVIVNYFNISGSYDKRPARDQIQRAVAEGYRLARLEGGIVSLRYEAENGALSLSDQQGKELARITLPGVPEDGEMTFYRIKPESQLTEEPNFEAEEDPVEVLDFQPYGASLPFLVHYTHGTEAFTLRFDAFSALSWEEEDVL